MRVAAGAIARKVLGDGVSDQGRPGPDRRRTGSTAPSWNWNEVERNPFWCPDATAAARWEALLDGRAQARLVARAR